MTRKQYAENHWIRSGNAGEALRAYKEQQGKAYSKVKNLFVRELLGNMEGKRFLDYGCGAGMFCVYAAGQGTARVVGVDAEETVLSTARFFTGQEGVQEKCGFVASKEWPFVQPGSPFDVILLKDVIEHIEDDQYLLNSAAKNLAPGGTVIISTQNAFSLNYLIEGMYHRILRREKDWYGWDPTHLRFYTPWSLKKKLLKAGLRVVAWRSMYIIPHKFPAPPSSGRQFYRLEFLTLIDKTLGHIYPLNRVGWNIIVKAIKVSTATGFTRF